MKFNFLRRGITLLLAILIMTSAMSVVLGIFNTIFGQLQINKAARESYKAFYSADAVKECAHYYIKKVNPARSAGFWDAIQPCNGDVNCTINCGGTDIRIGGVPPLGTMVVTPTFGSNPAPSTDPLCTGPTGMRTLYGLGFDPIACRRFIFNVSTGGVSPICANPVTIDTYVYDDAVDLLGNFGTVDPADSEVVVITARGNNACANPIVTRTIEICDSPDPSLCPQ